MATGDKTAATDKTRPGGDLLTIGETFGAFRVEGLLGRGGMGAVYLVRAADGKAYAAKIMAPPKSGNGTNDAGDEASSRDETHEWRRRFAHEAAFALKIRHPNLIAVYDVGEDPETHLCYIIMEHVGGGTLTKKLAAKGRLAVREAVSIAAQIARALEVAHRAGVVHRDLKPDNIMFDESGVPKLADLGIAKFSGAGDKAVTTVTQTGVIMGTPAYMSPEQMIDSHQVDARSDIYSLGMVLYEMLTGERPRAKASMVELLAKAIQGEDLPDVRTKRRDVPDGVQAVLARLTAHKPEDRPQTAAEAARLLQDAAEGRIRVIETGEEAAPDGMRRRRSGWWTLGAWTGAFLAGVFVAGVVIRAVLWRAEPPSDRAAGDLPVVTNVVNVVHVITNTVEIVSVVTNIVDDVEEPVVVAKAPPPSEMPVAETVPVTAPEPVAEPPKPESAPEPAPAPPEPEPAPVPEPPKPVPPLPAIKPEPEPPKPAVKKTLQRDFANGREWCYTVEDGQAILTSSREKGYDSSPCVLSACVGLLAIPKTLGGMPVGGIGPFAFNQCAELTIVEIPDSVRRIDENAFNGCARLAAVNIPPGVTKPFGAAFQACPKLRRVTLAWSHPAFAVKNDVVYSKALDEVVYQPAGLKAFVALPRSVVSIAPYAYNGGAFTKAAVPGHVKHIGARAFAFCRNLGELRLNKGLETIGEGAFSYTGLRQLAIPQGVTCLADETFRGCPALERVALPETLARIEGDNVFKACPALKSLHMNGNAPELTGRLFGGKKARRPVILVWPRTTGWGGEGGKLPKAWPQGQDARPVKEMR